MNKLVSVIDVVETAISDIPAGVRAVSVSIIERNDTVETGQSYIAQIHIDGPRAKEYFLLLPGNEEPINPHFKTVRKKKAKNGIEYIWINRQQRAEGHDD